MRQDRAKLDMSSQNLGEICPKCVCIACPRKKEGKWTFCLQCRSFYSAQFHCRCHSWFQMDNVPFYLPKYDHRVYDSYFDVKKLVKGECEICKAKLLPYNKREPCNFLKHHESHEHLIDENKDKNITRNSRPSQLIFCLECQWVKNFQCPFCSSKFCSSELADKHIANNHGDIVRLDQDQACCYICEQRPEWDKLESEMKGARLQKWINAKMKVGAIKIRESGEKVGAIKVHESCDNLVKMGERDDKISYSEIVKRGVEGGEEEEEEKEGGGENRGYSLLFPHPSHKIQK